MKRTNIERVNEYTSKAEHRSFEGVFFLFRSQDYLFSIPLLIINMIQIQPLNLSDF